MSLPEDIRSLRQNSPRPLGLYMMLLKTTEATALSRVTDPVAQEDIRQKAAQDVETFLAGVKKYREFDWARTPATDKRTVATFGRVVLEHRGGAGAPILLVPSLINKAYVMDLYDEASLIRHLVAAGHSVYLLDWHTPDDGHALTLDSAIEQALLPALEAVHEEADEKVDLLGYCMGGLLALAAARLRDDLIHRFISVATPWDFSQMSFHTLMRQYAPFYDMSLEHLEQVPVDILQTAFMMLDPFGPVRRFQAFAAEEDAAQLKRMAALEDWLADGVALEAGVAKPCLEHWYTENAPVNGAWRVGGRRIDAAKIMHPSLVVLPNRDLVVPRDAATPLADQLPNAQVLDVPAGHIGLMVGRKAKDHFFTPLTDWLAKTD